MVYQLPADLPIALKVSNLSLYYGNKQILDNITLNIPKNRVTALIGPSGCGKSALLRCFNRMNDLIDRVRTTGSVMLEGLEVNKSSTDVIGLRRRIGMVFQKSNPFPMTILENVVYGLKIAGIKDRALLREACEQCLRAAALWDEVKDRLEANALSLSGGQMQRLCIARAIAINPEVLLLDEPCSALDPIATARIEKLIHDLRERYTVVVVTHNMQQASRVADYTAFLLDGGLVEFNETETLFTMPDQTRTEDYITGRFG
ncbi:phosphate ABC transporter ATP-binding protein PstB [Acanthopleuribacter pedis]|uniref:Phosphate ABC transporter ATP-binding protein n=1 Tax=Acanthopleuribacter pedis TaxID=442870 RepID=A0A8J7U306_9BACT|nr:phosphate ABC transporter ATP-binding protein PstB [Acanthopleuribacter pedis]MBO1319127.1 phosphate ABC transporter ATP-binding protein [Acanthopleuribacter pedis]